MIKHKKDALQSTEKCFRIIKAFLHVFLLPQFLSTDTLTDPSEVRVCPPIISTLEDLRASRTQHEASLTYAAVALPGFPHQHLAHTTATAVSTSSTRRQQGPKTYTPTHLPCGPNHFGPTARASNGGSAWRDGRSYLYFGSTYMCHLSIMWHTWQRNGRMEANEFSPVGYHCMRS